MKTIEKEIQLLLACARTNSGPEMRNSIGKLASDPGMDWDFVYRLSVHHRVMPLVYSNLKSLPFLPDEVAGAFRNAFLINLARNSLLADELVTILDLLGKNGIPAVPFKGPVLAETAYGDIGLRMFSDLDILVHSRDAVRSRDVLVQSGYTADIPLTGGKALKYVENENFFRLVREGTGVIVDLHWEMTGLYSLCPIVLDDLMQKGMQKGKIGKFHGHSAIKPDMAVLFMYLCIHNSSHCWDNLDSVACLSALIEKKGIDVIRLLRLANTMRARRMVLTGLFLCVRLYGNPLPDAVIRLLQEDRGVRRICNGVVDRIFLDPDDQIQKRQSWRYAFIHFKIRDSVTDSIRYGIRLLFRPTVKEWMYFPVSRQWSFVHFFLRPLRLIFTYVAGKKRRH